MTEFESSVPPIGGEMELDMELLWGGTGSPDQFDESIGLFVTSARTAIKMILNRLNCGPATVFLLPAYLCKSILQPFREKGVQVEFFQVDADLAVDTHDLVRLVTERQAAGVLFINYFGFPPDQAAIRVIEGLKERCWIIEDCAHAPIGNDTRAQVGSVGHFVVTSFRKYLPFPDGGLLIDRTSAGFPQLPPGLDSFVRARLVAKLLRYEFIHGLNRHEHLENAYLNLFQEAEREIDRYVPMSGMSRPAQLLFTAVDLAEATRRRRTNFTRLLSTFLESSALQRFGQPLLKELPPGVSPLLFPIRVAPGLRDQLLQLMMQKRVFCPVHWPLPPEIITDRFPQANRLSSQILGLPVDQRYGERDMDTLVERILYTLEEMK